MKEQPPASEYPDSEFTKVQRKAAQSAVDAYEEDQEWCPTKTLRLLEACDRLDHSEASRKELLKACKRMLGAITCDELNNEQVFDDDLRKEVKEQAKQAIAKAGNLTQ